MEATADAMAAFFTFMVFSLKGVLPQLRLAGRLGFDGLGEKGDLDGPFLGHHRRQLLYARQPALGVLRPDLVLVAVEVLDARADADPPVGEPRGRSGHLLGARL